MGADDEDDLSNSEDQPALEHNDPRGDDDGENLVITGDVSSIHVIGPAIRPRSIRLTGSIHESKVSVLIDGGSTHNFIKPAFAEQLSLTFHSISPFRVFVGNGASLKCSYACLHTPIVLQEHKFDIDQFILQVEGPDVILGVQLLQELGDVTKNYRKLTMRFDWEDKPVLLQGEGGRPKQISFNNLFSLMGSEPDSEVFEIVALPPSPEDQTPAAPHWIPAFSRYFTISNLCSTCRKGCPPHVAGTTASTSQAQSGQLTCAPTDIRTFRNSKLKSKSRTVSAVGDPA